MLLGEFWISSVVSENACRVTVRRRRGVRDGAIERIAMASSHGFGTRSCMRRMGLAADSSKVRSSRQGRSEMFCRAREACVDRATEPRRHRRRV